MLQRQSDGQSRTKTLRDSAINLVRLPDHASQREDPPKERAQGVTLASMSIQRAHRYLVV
jgi:hypothetical protein